MKTTNWSADERKLLLQELAKGTMLDSIAQMLDRSENAVYLYCYRNRIPCRGQHSENSMMRKLLTIKFGCPEYFQPGREFYRRVKISQKRWPSLANGYEQATEEELKRVAKEFNFTIDEMFQLMDARQLDLFPTI